MVDTGASLYFTNTILALVSTGASADVVMASETLAIPTRLGAREGPERAMEDKGEAECREGPFSEEYMGALKHQGVMAPIWESF